MSEREPEPPLWAASRRGNHQTEATGRPGESHAEGFARFHAENPEVLTKLVELADLGRSRGVTRWGIGRLFEKLRWDHAIATRGETFALNNNYRAFYVRLILARRPDLEGFFEMRASMADSDLGGAA